jgi:hypothetical protein
MLNQQRKRSPQVLYLTNLILGNENCRIDVVIRLSLTRTCHDWAFQIIHEELSDKTFFVFKIRLNEKHAAIFARGQKEI